MIFYFFEYVSFFGCLEQLMKQKQSIGYSIKLYISKYLLQQSIDSSIRMSKVQVKESDNSEKEETEKDDNNVKKIKHYSFNLNYLLGQGNFSKVYRGVNQKTNQLVAIKIVDLSNPNSQQIKPFLNSQIQILKKIKYPNVLCCHDVVYQQDKCYIVTELCPNGDLQNLIKKSPSGFLQETQIQLIAYDIFKAILYLNERGIVHRDIKVANVFQGQNCAKLADFGFAKFSRSNFVDISIGSPIYMAPQSLIKNIYGPKTDIWAYGVLLYELTHGVAPYSNCQNEYELKKQLNIQILKENLKKTLSQQFKDLVVGCMNVDYKKRFSIKEIQKSNWIKMIQDKIQTRNNIQKIETVTQIDLQNQSSYGKSKIRKSEIIEDNINNHQNKPDFKNEKIQNQLILKPSKNFMKFTQTMPTWNNIIRTTKRTYTKQRPTQQKVSWVQQNTSENQSIGEVQNGKIQQQDKNYIEKQQNIQYGFSKEQQQQYMSNNTSIFPYVFQNLKNQKIKDRNSQSNYICKSLKLSKQKNQQQSHSIAETQPTIQPLVFKRSQQCKYSYESGHCITNLVKPQQQNIKLLSFSMNQKFKQTKSTFSNFVQQNQTLYQKLNDSKLSFKTNDKIVEDSNKGQRNLKYSLTNKNEQKVKLEFKSMQFISLVKKSSNVRELERIPSKQKLIKQMKQKNQFIKPIIKQSERKLDYVFQDNIQNNYLPGGIQFVESVGILHYCRLLYKFIKLIQELYSYKNTGLLSKWLITILNQLLKKVQKGQISYSNLKNIKERKLKNALEEYIKKYTKQLFYFSENHQKNKHKQDKHVNIKHLAENIRQWVQFVDKEIQQYSKNLISCSMQFSKYEFTILLGRYALLLNLATQKLVQCQQYNINNELLRYQLKNNLNNLPFQEIHVSGLKSNVIFRYFENNFEIQAILELKRGHPKLSIQAYENDKRRLKLENIIRQNLNSKNKKDHLLSQSKEQTIQNLSLVSPFSLSSPSNCTFNDYKNIINPNSKIQQSSSLGFQHFR